MTITLPVTTRDKAQTSAALRRDGLVPAVVYGPKHPAETLAVDGKALLKILQTAGESSIVELTGLKAPIEVLVKDVAFDPLRKLPHHVDFYAIERGKDMTLHVPLEFIGESPAEKDGVGSVTKVLHEIEVTCRPSNIPAHINVDISVLIDAESKITVADLVVPAGVTIENEPTDTIAVISVQKEEVDEVSTVDMDAIAVEAKGKTDKEAAS
jgi:large subunit ribosomal protein L25